MMRLPDYLKPLLPSSDDFALELQGVPIREIDKL
jgi:hypothetical protein